MGILRVDKLSGLEAPTAVTGSVLFDGTGDYLAVTPINNSFVNWWQSDFTIEAWIYADSYADWWFNDAGAGNDIPAMVGHFEHDGATNYWSFGPVSDNTVKFYYWKGSQNHTFVTSDKVVVGEWSHIAMTYSVANGAKLFINGRGTDYISLSGTPQADISAAEFNVGQYNSESITGYVSNLRILNGTALYTSDFTPPVHELQPIGDTVLLCCNNPDSAGADGTGKTITVNGDAAGSTFSPGLTKDFTFGTEFRGVTTFDTQGYFVPPSGTTTERFPDFGAVDAASARGVFAGGYSPGETNIIDYVTISTLGNAQDFGDLTAETEYPAGTSDRTRGLTLGGQTGSDAINTVSFVTIASTGDASDFGDLTNALRQKGALANSTRAIAVGGSPTSSPFPANNVMDYFTIQSSGNALNFGDLTELTNYGNPTASSVRGVFSGMSNPNGSVVTNTISYVTISTTGNAQNFGDLDFTGSGGGGLSNSTRGVIARDNNTELDFITIASLGNSQDFGTLTGNARYNTDAAVSSSTRGLFMIGAPAGNGINYITIPSTGNGQDFGDLTRSPGGDAGFSNGHGGLG